MDRRTFLKGAGTLAAAALGLDGTAANEGRVPRRRLGRTGVELSIIGLGGIVVANTEPDEARRIVVEAYERGINYFDVAPSYGNSEERLGPALEGLRDRVFLACKTEKRDRAGAATALRESLQRLRTDHFDLYQLHGLAKREDLEKAMGPGGALEAVAEARKEGLIRWIGFSAHSAEVALEAMERFSFDTILFPVNFVTWIKAGFGPQVIAAAEKRGMGCLALKAMALGRMPKGTPRTYPKCWYQPIDDPRLASLALRFTLSQPITAAVPPGDVRLFRMALNAASQRFQPLTKGELAELERIAATADPIFRLAA
ncbi:MAG TPA: aldo/keto reductase [Armatimonadetes bacterium]|jgi:aryl-alcohol dehydrogenase-like predicted oxidoreductase|nr:aldo/keto reductase [Armatimonadota bacterium]